MPDSDDTRNRNGSRREYEARARRNTRSRMADVSRTEKAFSNQLAQIDTLTRQIEGIKRDFESQTKSSLHDLDSMASFLDSEESARKHLEYMRKKSMDVYKQLEEEQRKFKAEISWETPREVVEMHQNYLKGLMNQARAMENEYKDTFDLIHDNLDDVDTHIEEVFAENFSSHVQDVGTEFHRVIEDMGYDFDEFIENATEQTVEVKDSLMDWANALNINDISNSIKDAADEFSATDRDIANKLGWSNGEREAFRKASFDLARNELHNRISEGEVVEIANVVMDSGMSNVEDINKYTKEMAKASTALGVEASNLSDLMNAAWFAGDETMITEVSATMRQLQKEANINFDADTTLQELGEMTESIQMLTMGLSEEDQARAMREAAVGQSVASSNFLNSFSSDLFSELSQSMNGMVEDQTKWNYALGAGGTRDIWASLQAGNFEEAYSKFFSRLQQNAGNFTKQDLQILVKNGTLTQEEAVKLFNKQNIDSAVSEMSAAMELQPVENPDEYLDKSIAENSQDIKTTVDNWMANNPVTEAITNLTGDMNLSLGNILLAIEGLRTFRETFSGENLQGMGKILQKLGGKGKNPLTKGLGKLGDFLSDITGEAPSAGGGGAAAANKGGGLLGKIADLIGGGKGAAAAGEVAGETAEVAGKAGSTIVKSLGKLAAPLAALGLGFDTFEGATSSAERWFGEEANAGQRFSSGVGSLLGGSGSGIFDEGTDVMTKAMDVGGGALKGAGVGMLFGPIGAAIGAGVGAVGSAIGGENIAKFLQGTGDFIGNSANWVWGKIQDAGSGIADMFSNLTEDLSNTGLGQAIGNFTNAITTGASNIWSGVSNFFGNAWEGVTSTASSLWGGVSDFFAGVFGLNQGEGNSYAGGLSNVPFDNLVARLHEGEAVLTEEQANLFRRVSADGGIDIGSVLTSSQSGLIDKLSNTMARPIKEGSLLDTIEQTFQERFKPLTDIRDAVMGEVARSPIGQMARGVMGMLGIQTEFFDDEFPDYTGKSLRGIKKLGGSSISTPSVGTTISAAVTKSVGEATNTALENVQDAVDAVDKLSESTISSPEAKTEAADKALEAIAGLSPSNMLVDKLTKSEEREKPSGTSLDGLGGVAGLTTPMATGTNYVPQDMLAFLHRGEAVVPADFNQYPNGNADNPAGDLTASYLIELIQVMRDGFRSIRDRMDNANNGNGNTVYNNNTNTYNYNRQRENVTAKYFSY